MRKICLMIVFLLWPGAVVFAVAPVTADSIAAAQEYGKSKAAVDQREFFLPWTAYEEKAVRLNEVTDRAYLYTPFLLLAADARDKAASGAAVRSNDADKVLSEYKGYMVFGATLFGSEPEVAGKTAAVLKQGKRIVKAQLIYGPGKAERVTVPSGRSSIFAVQLYVYFAAKDVAMDKPGILQITSDKKRESRFYFDLAQFK